MGGGGTLPSTGMWQGEVFAISDCLVIAALKRIEGRLDNIETGLNSVNTFKAQVKVEIKQIQNEVNKLSESNLRLETHIRRNNLLFHNVAESEHDTENTTAVIKGIISNKLNLSADDVAIEGAFRLGKKRSNSGRLDSPPRARPILVQFLRYMDRMEVLTHAKNLARTGMAIAEDYPKILQARRKKLIPAMLEMKRRGTRCYIRTKGTDFVLYVDGNPYMSASDLDGDSDEARDLRQQFAGSSETRRSRDRLGLSSFRRHPASVERTDDEDDAESFVSLDSMDTTLTAARDQVATTSGSTVPLDAGRSQD